MASRTALYMTSSVAIVVWSLLLLLLDDSMGFHSASAMPSSNRRSVLQWSTKTNGNTNSNDDDGSSDDDDKEFLKSLTESFFLGNDPQQQQQQFPTTPPPIKTPPSKSDLYQDAELQNLLDLHQQLYSQTTERRKQQEEEQPPEEMIPSIHDLVLQTVGGAIDKDGERQQQKALEEEEEEVEDDNNNVESSSDYPWLTDEIRQRIPKVRAIASDVDGTLIASDQTVPPRTKGAIQNAVKAAFSPLGKIDWFFPATGKTRTGVLNSLGPELATLVAQCPGVFIQGLYCVYGDRVIFEQKLTTPAIKAAEEIVAKWGTSIIAYDGDDLYTTDLTPTVVELHELYGEPPSTEIDSVAGHANGFHKILICDHDLEKLAQVRTELEAMAEDNGATVTQAVPTMLELIPKGCSKGLGVQKLCEVLGVDPATQLLALGDAENDVEMLKMAAIGVAVGNGCALAKDAADVVLEETNDEGGAGIAMETLAEIL